MTSSPALILAIGGQSFGELLLGAGLYAFMAWLITMVLLQMYDAGLPDTHLRSKDEKENSANRISKYCLRMAIFAALAYVALKCGIPLSSRDDW